MALCCQSAKEGSAPGWLSCKRDIPAQGLYGTGPEGIGTILDGTVTPEHLDPVEAEYIEGIKILVWPVPLCCIAEPDPVNQQQGLVSGQTRAKKESLRRGLGFSGQIHPASS